MGFLGSLRFRQYKKSLGTDTITFQAEKVAKGEIVQVTSAYVTDYTTANKKLVLGIRDVAGIDHYILTVQETLTFEAHLTGRIYLISGERLIGIVTSPSENDECYFTADGERYAIPGT